MPDSAGAVRGIRLVIIATERSLTSQAPGMAVDQLIRTRINFISHEFYFKYFARPFDLTFRSADIFDLIEILTIALRFHPVLRNEPKRSGVDAVAKATAIYRAVRKDMTQMAVPMGRAHFRSHHAM